MYEHQQGPYWHSFISTEHLRSKHSNMFNHCYTFSTSVLISLKKTAYFPKKSWCFRYTISFILCIHKRNWILVNSNHVLVLVNIYCSSDLSYLYFNFFLLTLDCIWAASICFYLFKDFTKALMNYKALLV